MAVATASEQAQPDSKHNVQPARQAYYDKIAKFHMAPLWEVLKDLVTPEPKRKSSRRPGSFPTSRTDAGSRRRDRHREAERRVLVLENPGMPGKSRVTIRCSPASS